MQPDAAFELKILSSTAHYDSIYVASYVGAYLIVCFHCSALASAAVSIMAKIRMAEKVDLPKSTLLQPLDQQHSAEKRSPTQAVKMASSLDSSPSSSYSSSPDSRDLDDLIDSVQGIKIVKGHNIVNNDTQSFDEEYPSILYKRVTLSSDDEKNSDEDDDDDEGLIERGPVRPQLHPLNRTKPYVESSVHNWSTSSSVNQPSENSTDYDTSAKAILTDREYREKIDFCLDKLSDSMSQGRSVTNSLSPVHSDFGGTSSSYSVSKSLGLSGGIYIYNIYVLSLKETG